MSFVGIHIKNKNPLEETKILGLRGFQTRFKGVLKTLLQDVCKFLFCVK